MRRSARRPGSRTGGPAEVLFRPADAEDLATFLSGAAGRRAGHGAGRGLELSRPRRRHQGRGDPPAARLHRHHGRRPRGGGRRRCARPQRGADGARAFAGRPGIPERHSRHDRRRVPDQCRRLWRRARRGADLGRGGRSRRQDLHRDAGASSAFPIATARRRPTGSSPRRGCRAAPGDQLAIARRIAEIDSARADSQPRSRTGGSTFANPPGHKAWELIDAAGCRGLQDRRRAGLREAHQFPDQSRRRDRFRHREAGRGGAPARVRQERRAARMGDPPPRRGSE